MPSSSEGRAFCTPEGWTREAVTRFRHTSGILIQLTEEYGHKGWCIVPNNDDRSVRWFAPTLEGRDEAFRTFEKESSSFQRKEPRRPDDHLLKTPCRNCGAKTSFFPEEVERSVRGLCEDCYNDLRR
jgi:hypothetical protein